MRRCLQAGRRCRQQPCQAGGAPTHTHQPHQSAGSPLPAGGSAPAPRASRRGRSTAAGTAPRLPARGKAGRGQQSAGTRAAAGAHRGVATSLQAFLTTKAAASGRRSQARSGGQASSGSSTHRLQQLGGQGSQRGRAQPDFGTKDLRRGGRGNVRFGRLLQQANQRHAVLSPRHTPGLIATGPVHPAAHVRQQQHRAAQAMQATIGGTALA